MHFTADRASLADAVKWVTGAIDVKRPSSPAASGIEIVAGTDYVTLTGHDFDKMHTATVAAEVAEPGTAIPVALMVRDLLNALKGETVEVSAEAQAQRVTIASGRSSYKVNTFAPGAWPKFPTHDLAERGTVDADELRRCLAMVGPAADDNNPVARLKGVRLEAFDADELAVVGVSSTHMSAAIGDYEGETFTAQLPISSATEAARGLSGAVTISSSDGTLGLADASRSVVLRVFDAAEFPDWRKYMGDIELSSAVEVEAELLRDACKRVALTCAASNEPLTLDIKDGEVKVSAAGDTAKGSEAIDYDGNLEQTADWTTSVLLPVLATLPPGEVRLSFAEFGSGRPMRLTDKAGSFRHVVMPRRARA